MRKETPTRKKQKNRARAEKMQSRAGEMIRGFVPDDPEMTMESVKSATLDDRISNLISEIQDGKRDVRIRRLAADILREYSVPARDWKAETTAVFHWVRQNIRYTRDPTGVELFQKPRRTVELGIADCDDLSILICSLLGSIGHVMQLRTIGITERGQAEHIYPLDLLPPSNPTEYIALDASRPEPMGWEVPDEQIKFKQDYLVD